MSTVQESAQETAGAGGSAALLLGGVLLATALVAVPLALAALRRLGPPGRRVTPPWTLVHAAAFTVAAFLVLLAAGLLVPDPGVLASLYLSEAILAAPALLALLFAIRHSPDGLSSMGLRPSGNGRAVLAGALAFFVLYPALLGWYFTWPVIAGWIGQDIPPQGVLTDIQGLGGAALAQAVFVAVVLGPLLEEMVFRGFLQPFLVNRLGTASGLVTTAFLFALLHGAPYVAPLFAVGLLLGVIQLRTQRLAAAWVVHALHNGITLLLALRADDWIERFSS